MSRDRLKRLTEQTELTEAFSEAEMDVIKMVANNDYGSGRGGASIKDPKHLQALASLVQKKLIYVNASSLDSKKIAKIANDARDAAYYAKHPIKKWNDK